MYRGHRALFQDRERTYLRARFNVESLDVALKDCACRFKDYIRGREHL